MTTMLQLEQWKLKKICDNQNKSVPNSARIVAGYCWPWLKQTNPDGSLINEVIIDDFEMPWEAPFTGKLEKGIPRPEFWAYLEGGKSQVGCIYTCQGFEFHTVCVIIGKDLLWDKSRNEFSGYPGRENVLPATPAPSGLATGLGTASTLAGIYRLINPSQPTITIKQ